MALQNFIGNMKKQFGTGCCGGANPLGAPGAPGAPGAAGPLGAAAGPLGAAGAAAGVPGAPGLPGAAEDKKKLEAEKAAKA